MGVKYHRAIRALEHTYRCYNYSHGVECSNKERGATAFKILR